MNVSSIVLTLAQMTFISSPTFYMFKAKIHLYKNVDGKEEEIKKEFDSQEAYDAFLKANPDLEKLSGFKWEPMKWPSLSGFKDLFSDFQKLGSRDYVQEMEKEIEDMEKSMSSLFEKSKKLLSK